MIAQKTVDYAKEIDDVLVLVIELVKDIKAKKEVGALAAENLPNLINAIGGVDQIPAEAANTIVAAQTVGYRAGELAASLIG